MGKDADLLEAARSGNFQVVEKILSSKAKIRTTCKVRLGSVKTGSKLTSGQKIEVVCQCNHLRPPPSVNQCYHLMNNSVGIRVTTLKNISECYQPGAPVALSVASWEDDLTWAARMLPKVIALHFRQRL
ncbi:hypothetical protein Hamer_G025400 [Homarus americanus]|uniref:Uncharacterized protein n=1 Tax=Homarus americanus TaxID=6706 RepID=A0A8J5JCJ4_HOMAM|nr:hypothetical protein Hamer_G025400 [Homarus americanus]